MGFWEDCRVRSLHTSSFFKRGNGQDWVVEEVLLGGSRGVNN